MPEWGKNESGLFCIIGAGAADWVREEWHIVRAKIPSQPSMPTRSLSPPRTEFLLHFQITIFIR